MTPSITEWALPLAETERGRARTSTGGDLAR
jgi:hypothetical protein